MGVRRCEQRVTVHVIDSGAHPHAADLHVLLVAVPFEHTRCMAHDKWTALHDPVHSGA